MISLNLTTIFFAIAAIVGAVYVFVPGFRAQVNQLVRVTWSKLFGSAVSPIDRQKDQYKQAIALLGQQKESVVKLTAQGDLDEKELRRRNEKVTAVLAKYAEAKELYKNDPVEKQNEVLNKIALEVKAAKDAVESQKAIVAVSSANVKRATESLARTTVKIQQFAQHIQDNEGKLALAAALNVQAQAEALANSINDVLSDAGQADQEIDRILAEAEARNKIEQGDPIDADLEKRRKEEEARKEREKLDQQTGGAK